MIALLTAALLLAQAKPPAAAPVPFEKLAAQAEAARAADKIDQAIPLYRQALKAKPAWKEGWWFLGTLLYDKDIHTEAAPVFRKLVELDPENGPALALLGLCEYQTKDYGQSIAHLLRARNFNLGDNQQMLLVVTYHAALIQTKYRRFESALELLLETSKRGMSSPKTIEATGLAALRMPLLPVEILEKDRELIMLAGAAATAASERKGGEAQKAFDQLLARYPNTPNVHYIYGAYLMLNDPDAGVQQFLAELAIQKTHLPTLVSLALEYIKRGEPAKGLEYAQTAVKSAPESFAAHAALGRVLVDSGTLDDGIKELETAEKLAPDSPQVRIALASAYAKAGRHTDAARERAEFSKLKNGK